MDPIENLTETKYECLFFDMDDTLYPLSTGFDLVCRRYIEEFMMNHLHIEEEKVKEMCLELYVEHGTTLAGLKALGYQFDSCEFHDYIHGKLPYENLKPDHVLRNLLLSLPQRKLVFTNADKAHAGRVLSRLGIEDCFEGIICFETLNPSAEHEADSDKSLAFENGKSIVDANGSSLSGIEKSTGSSIILCKPSPVAFEVALAIGNINPAKTVFFDDSTRNIAAAKASGLTTVIVGREELVPGADFALNSIHNLREAMPELWECGEGGQLREVLPLAGVETVVLA